MLLTRRTFVQSSIAASLAAAAEATHASWLLKPDNAVRIAIADLGPFANEHISLFAALPGVEIVALVDPSHSKSRAAIAQLTQLGRPTPAVYASLSSLLRHTGIDAFSLAADEEPAAFSLHEILATRRPILLDLPPRDLSLGDLMLLQKAPVYFRTSDRLYPGAQTEIHAQWKRSPLKPETGTQKRFTRLILERRLRPSQLRAVLIAALGAVLEPLSIPVAALAAWSEDPAVIEFTRASTVLHIHLPPQLSNFDSLDIDLLPRSFGASILSLGQPQGTMQVPIWRAPDIQSSLRTVMAFLSQNHARFAKHTSSTRTYTADNVTDVALAFAAASVVDRAVTFTNRK
ncbi:MAG: hypothetical protein WBP85_01505 [Terracidiphilus sp.]